MYELRGLVILSCQNHCAKQKQNISKSKFKINTTKGPLFIFDLVRNLSDSWFLDIILYLEDVKIPFSSKLSVFYDLQQGISENSRCHKITK